MSNSNEGLMADPYASSGGSGSLAAPPPLSSPSGDFAPTPAAAPAVADDLFLNVSTAPAATPDYLFEENYDENFRRGFGERLTYHVGGMYSIGFVFGSSWGLMKGLADSKGQRQRIRVNSVLNSMGSRGPGLANSLGCVAMMASIFESLAYNVRGEDDLLNPAGAAALTGVLYKSTSGLRMSAIFGVGLGALGAAGAFVTRHAKAPRAIKNLM